MKALIGFIGPALADNETAVLAMRSAARHRFEIHTQLMPDFACQDLLDYERRKGRFEFNQGGRTIGHVEFVVCLRWTSGSDAPRSMA